MSRKLIQKVMASPFLLQVVNLCLLGNVFAETSILPNSKNISEHSTESGTSFISNPTKLPNSDSFVHVNHDLSFAQNITNNMYSNVNSSSAILISPTSYASIPTTYVSSISLNNEPY